MIIDVQNLSYTYHGAARAAVQNLTFAIEPGEIFGFLGPSGAGKSTTQKVLIGLLTGYQGAVTVLGRDLAGWGAGYYERIGVSFELPNHYLKLTAVENLAYFRSLYRGPTADPQDLLAQVGLENDGHLRVGQFSKGMKNRLTLARALLHRPELLFLDEPTAGLDPVNAGRVKALIQAEKAAGKTIFLTTHDMGVAETLCDRVAFIVNGEIKTIDSPRRLKLAHGRASLRVEYQTNGQVAGREFPLADLGHNPDFWQLLQNQPVQTMHTQEATLEEIFIQVTGQRLR